MAKTAKKKSSKGASGASRESDYVVARQAVRSDRFTSRQIREAVRKAKAARKQREAV